MPTKKRTNVLVTGLILALIFALSFYLQYGLLDKVKEVALGAMDDLSAKGLGLSLVPVVLKSFSTFDWLVIGAFLGLFAAVVLLQIFRQGIGDFVEAVLESDLKTVLFLLFLGVLFFKVILAPGEPYFMDAPSHVSRAWVTALNFSDGYAFPSWTNYYHNGFALFSHYGWLYYYLSAVFNLGVNQIDLACKLVTFLLSLGNVVLFYLLGKKLFGHRRAAFVLALFFVCANFYLYEIMWVGALFFPVIVLGALVLFLALELFLSGNRGLVVPAALTALGANLLIHTHLGFAAQILVFFAPWALVRMVLFYREKWKSFIVYTLVSMGLGAVLAAFIFLPTFLDMGDVNFYKAFPFSDPGTYKFWVVPFWQFLVPRPFYTQFNYDYMGLALAALGVTALVVSVKKPSRWTVLTLALALVTLLVIGYYRNNILVFFSLALFTAAALHRWPGLANPRVMALIFIAVFTDGLLFNNFNTYDNRKTSLDQAFTRLEKEPDGTRYAAVDANTLHTGNKTDGQIFTSPWLKVVGHRLLQPNAIMLEANKQALYQYGVTNDLLVADVQSGKLSDTTLQALDLLGVKYLLCHNSQTYFVPPLEPRPFVEGHSDGPWVDFTSTRALVWAPATIAWADLHDDQLDKMRHDFEKDDASHTNAPFHYREGAGTYIKALAALENPSLDQPVAAQFVLRQGKSEVLASPGVKAKVEVQDFRVDSQTLKYDFSVDQKGFIAIPFAWFPYLNVQVDGQKVESFPTAFNTVCVKVADPGHHVLTVGPSLSKARIVGAWTSGLGALGILIGVVILVVRQRKRN